MRLVKSLRAPNFGQQGEIPPIFQRPFSSGNVRFRPALRLLDEFPGKREDGPENPGSNHKGNKYSYRTRNIFDLIARGVL
jgi:hypothetical protein